MLKKPNFDLNGSKFTVNLVLVCLFSSIGSFAFGFDNGWWSGVLGNALFNDLYGELSPEETGTGSRALSASQQSNGTALGTAGIMLGCMAAPFLNQYWGRKGAFMAIAVVGIVGTLIQALSVLNYSYYMLVAGKIIVNSSVGIASATAPAFQAECAPAQVRGALTNVYNLLQNFAGVIAGGVIWAVQARSDIGAWEIPICLQFLPCIIILAGWPFVPESPRWLVEQGREEQAIKSVRMLRGAHWDAEGEVAEIVAAMRQEQERTNGARWGQLFKSTDLRRTLIIVGVQCLQQAQGISFMANYLLITFISLGINDVYMLLFFVYVMMFILNALLATWLFDKFGRRRLLLFGASVMFVCMLLVGTIVAVEGTPSGSLASLLIAACFIWFAVFCVTWGPGIWIVAAETGSNVLREKSLALGAWSGFSIGLITNLVTPYMQNAEYGNLGGRIGFVWMGFSFVSIIWVWFFVPELKQRTLEEVDEMFAQRLPTRKFRNYVSPSGHSAGDKERAHSIDHKESIRDEDVHKDDA